MNKKNIEKSYMPSKWLYVIFFTIPLLMTVLSIKHLDNDIWYLLSEGRYIIQHGIYHIDPLSMHEGLQVTVQNWLSASIFWGVYNGFGEMALYVVMLISNFFICLLLYKICNLISDENKLLSLITMLIADITLVSHFIVTRPQIFSFIILLSVIYVLELYIKKKNPKYLIWLPILSLIEVNIHASLWWMIFLFAIPYVIDSFKIPFLNTEGYEKKWLFISLGIAFLVGFINPYGYKAITFIFTSFGDKYMHMFIKELIPFTFSNTLCKHMFIIVLITIACLAFFRKGNVKVRYICLYCGTMILGFSTVKAFSHFIIVGIFPFAYFFKDMFPKDFSDLPINFKKVLNIILAIVSILLIGLFCYVYSIRTKSIGLNHNGIDAMKIITKYGDPNKDMVYASFNNGGLVEFYGFKPYIDPRAEVYLKINNKKADIFEEDYKLQHGQLNTHEFISKYNFAYMLIEKNDYLYSRMTDETNYFVFYDNTKLGFRLYIRNDLFSDEERAKIIESYNKIVAEAEAKANSNKTK